MRAAFFHDHRFRRTPDGDCFTGGNLPYAVLRRYLAHFDHLTVVGRCEGVADASALARSSGEGVGFACLPPGASPATPWAPGLRRHVRAVLERVDCAVIRLPSVVGLAAAAEAARAGRPWLAEVVGCAWDALWNHGAARTRLAAGPMWALCRRWIARAPYALYVSREFLQRRYPCAGAVEACSDVRIDPPRAEVLERRLARIAGPRRGPAVLGLVGSLDVDYKGHGTALRAVAALRRQGLAVRLRCLGGGDAARWRGLAAKLGVADQVEFTGTLPAGGAVFAWMDELDLFVVPSVVEGLPRALVEAMSRACPVVGSTAGGIPELLPARALHPPRDHARMAALVGEALRRPEQLAAAAAESFEAARRYAPESLDSRRSRFLERFAAAAGAPPRAGAAGRR